MENSSFFHVSKAPNLLPVPTLLLAFLPSVLFPSTRADVIVLINCGLGRLKAGLVTDMWRRAPRIIQSLQKSPQALYFKEASLLGRLVHMCPSAVPQADGAREVGDGGI